jgi:membrane protein
MAMARVARASEGDLIAGVTAVAGVADSMPDDPPGQGPESRRRILSPPFRTAVAAVRKWNAIDGGRLAAALAFYSILSLAPFLLLVVAVANWWLGTDTASQYLSSRIQI